MNPRMMMVLLGLLLSQMACQPKEAHVTYMLSDEQMARLILDVQLGEAAMHDLTGPKQDSLKERYWLRLTEVYKMSEPEIKEEIRKVEHDPEKFKQIMDRVQTLSDSIR